MILLQASHIYHSFSAVPVLENVNFSMRKNERIGLIGANGAGKTTLLKVLAGELTPEKGEIYKSKEINTGYLSQASEMDSCRTVWEELLEVFRPLLEQEKELRELEEKMGDPAVINCSREYRRVSEKYAALEEYFRKSGGYSYQASINSVLHGLNFINDYNTPVNSLSGGQKTRLALARLLMIQPEILILDEPTNYLDMESTAWLERYLQSYPGSILVVSHDRYFLDNLVNIILELENHKVTRYNGNYTRFLELKQHWIEVQQKEYEKYKAEKERLENFVQQNIARDATSGRAKAKRKQLQKMQPVEPPETGKKKAAISFDIQRSTGREVLSVRDLAIGYQAQPVAKNINFDLHRGERVALLGPNGTGKTTLLKTIAGYLPPVSGKITEGYHASTGYHHQEQDHLCNEKTVLDELWDRYPAFTNQEARDVLGNFLFSGEDVFKKVADLSGGERARLALAELMCKQANFLLMDEPTNHLDIYSREVLEDSLLEYPGTLLFVSHDRYFINKIATRVLELTSRGIIDYPGNFNYYLDRQKTLAAETRAEASSKEQQKEKPGKGKQDYLRNKEKQRLERKRQRRLRELETIIPETEEKISALEKELYTPEIYSDYTKYREISSELERLKAELEEYMEEWVRLEDGEINEG